MPAPNETPDFAARATLPPHDACTPNDDPSPGVRHTPFWLIHLAVFLYAACVFLPFLGARTLTPHEILAVHPAQRMLADGEWIVPRYGGAYWLDKPPLVNWMTAASLAVAGGFGEFASRLPTALCAVALCVLMSVVTARFFRPPRIAFLAGLVQATCVYMFIEGRLAEPDMPFALMLACAHAVLLWNWGDGALRLSLPAAALFHFFAGLAVLAKGPAAVAFLAAGIFTFAALVRSWRPVRAVLLTPGIVVFLLIAGGWHVAAYKSVGPEALHQWGYNNLVRFIGQHRLGRSDNIFSYFYNLPWLLLPWTVVLILGAPKLRAALRGAALRSAAAPRSVGPPWPTANGARPELDVGAASSAAVDCGFEPRSALAETTAPSNAAPTHPSEPPGAARSHPTTPAQRAGTEARSTDQQNDLLQNDLQQNNLLQNDLLRNDQLQQRRTVHLYLWSWFLGGFAFLMLSQFKHKHYLLPILPPLTILTAVLLGQHFASVSLRQRRAYFGGFMAALPLFWLIGGYVMPSRDHRRVTVDFVRAETERIPKDEVLYVLGMAQAPVSPYIKHANCVYLDTPEEVERTLQSRGAAPIWILTIRRNLPLAEQYGFAFEETAGEPVRKKHPLDRTIILGKLTKAPASAPATQAASPAR